jgi:putative ABC transport system ATP-binding protein
VSPLIELRAVSKRYLDGDRERWVLRNFDLDIDSASTVAITGPSGSGKTTLLNLLAGLLLPEHGEIRLHDGDGTVQRLSALDARARAAYRRRDVGYVFQFFNLVPTLTVAENLRLPLALAGRRALLREALSRLDALGLGDRAAAFPAQLSGGEQQRVAIARALAHRPRLVLADEPTGNLDAENTALVADLLWRETAAAGATLVIATHNARIAERAGRQVRLAP